MAVLDVVFPVISPAQWMSHNYLIVVAMEVLICSLIWFAAHKGAKKHESDLLDPLLEEPTPSPNMSDPGTTVTGLKLALDHVTKDNEELVTGGASVLGFFIGILNLMLTCLVLAGLPEHLWTMYMVKCWFLIPLWWKTVGELHQGWFFLADFCWLAGIWFGIYFGLSMAGVLPPWLQKTGFLIFYGTGVGPISWANILLGNGITFHATIELVSLFIHLSPVLVTFTMLAFPDRLADAWPNRFPTAEVLDATTFAERYLHGCLFYSAWMVIHGFWLVTDGLTRPQRGYNTVYDWVDSKAGWGSFLTKKGIKNRKLHAVLYLATQWVLSQVAFALAAVLMKCLWAHALFAVINVLVTVKVGANKYYFLIVKKTERKLKKLLEAEEASLTRASSGASAASYQRRRSQLTPGGTNAADDDE